MSRSQDFLKGLSPALQKQFSLGSELVTRRLPTASYGLNLATDGGLARGRIATIHGTPSAGKSALMMQTVGIWQKEHDAVGVWVDTETSWDKEWARKLDINSDDIILVQNRVVDTVQKKIVPLIEGGVDYIVIDSISQIMPGTFLDKDGHVSGVENMKQIGAQARAIKKLMNSISLANEINGNNTVVVLLSQTTTEIGQTYTKQIPSGGKAVLFDSSYMIKLASSNVAAKQIQGDVRMGNKIVSRPIGNHVEGVVEKNKAGGARNSVFEYDIYFIGDHVGIDFISEIVEDAINMGAIEKRGGWFYFYDLEDETIDKIQGKDSVISYLRENQDVLEIVEKKLHLLRTGEVL